MNISNFQVSTQQMLRYPLGESIQTSSCKDNFENSCNSIEQCVDSA